MPVYMKYEGAQGSCTAQGYQNWIELYSCNFQSTRQVGTPSGRGTNRESSAPSVSEVSISKNLDTSSGVLYKASLAGKGVNVTIVMLKASADGSKLEEVDKLELQDTLVTNYSISAHGGDTHRPPVESMSLNSLVFTRTATIPGALNVGGTPMRVQYNAGTTVVS